MEDKVNNEIRQKLFEVAHDGDNPKATSIATISDPRIQDIVRNINLLNTISSEDRNMYQGMMLPPPEHIPVGLNTMEKLPAFTYPVIASHEFGDNEECSDGYREDPEPSPKKTFSDTTGFLRKWLNHVIVSTKKP